ncbi:LOB domain-containing protein 1-like [Nymphaea colorata]|nr:LOB domain-containing protein 1-like [Nymphaea colorata]
MQTSESLVSSPSSSPPSSPTPSVPTVIASPCAACKILRRRCVDQCVLAPYFPPSEPQKFITAHRVFGASNIIKLLQDLPESQRADAVSSLVYEANARTRDPVYGCAGTIFQLQKQLTELQSQLAMAKAEIHNMQIRQANLMAIWCMETAQSPQAVIDESSIYGVNNNSNDTYQHGQFQFQQGNCGFFDDANIGSLLEPMIWT